MLFRYYFVRYGRIEDGSFVGGYVVRIPFWRSRLYLYVTAQSICPDDIITNINRL